RPEGEEQLVGASGAVLLGEPARQSPAVLDLRERGERRIESLASQRLDARLVHARREVVADLRLHGAPRRGRVGRGLEQAPEVPLDLVLELSVDAPGGL